MQSHVDKFNHVTTNLWGLRSYAILSVYRIFKYRISIPFKNRKAMGTLVFIT